VGSRVRIGGGLLTALARAARPEDVVRVIVEQSDSLRSATSQLPGATARLIERIAQAQDADEVAVRGRSSRAPVADSRQAQTVKTDMLRPRRRSTAKTARATTGRGPGQEGGASQVMKLANKLMKLIHLAESQRRNEARAQIRMAEDSAAARAEAGHGAAAGKQEDSDVNLMALQQDVLKAVMQELELVQARREDPDGRNFWW